MKTLFYLLCLLILTPSCAAQTSTQTTALEALFEQISQLPLFEEVPTEEMEGFMAEHLGTPRYLVHPNSSHHDALLALVEALPENVSRLAFNDDGVIIGVYIEPLDESKAAETKAPEASQTQVEEGILPVPERTALEVAKRTPAGDPISQALFLIMQDDPDSPGDTIVTLLNSAPFSDYLTFGYTLLHQAQDAAGDPIPDPDVQQP